MEYIWYPYILNEDTPEEGSNIKPKIPPENLEKYFNRINGLGDEYGVKFNNDGSIYNTNRVHRAALYARDKNKLLEFGNLIFESIFTENKNISKKEIIDDMAKEIGLDIVEMNQLVDNGNYEQEIEEARRMAKIYNVTSVPTFVVDDKNNVTFLKDYESFKKDLENAGK